MGALQNIEKGQVLAALNDIKNSIESEFTSVESQFPSLASLVARLTSDEGAVAYQVAQDAYTSWEDGTPLLTVADNAVKEAASKGLTVAVQDVADWLGVIDRNPATATAAPGNDSSSSASVPATDSSSTAS